MSAEQRQRPTTTNGRMRRGGDELHREMRDNIPAGMVCISEGSSGFRCFHLQNHGWCKYGRSCKYMHLVYSHDLESEDSEDGNSSYRDPPQWRENNPWKDRNP